MRILFLLSLVFLLGAPAAIRGGGGACDLCDGSHRIECGRCEGKGKYRVVCRDCLGKKTSACNVCGEEGKFSCPNCVKGKIRWKGGGSDPCKLCGQGGKITCPFCRGKKTLACRGCERKGRIEKTCESCFGVGAFPCPKGPKPASASCTLCTHEGKVTCPVCLGKKETVQYCKKCSGFGLKWCTRKACQGGRVRCSKCSGAGKLRYVGGGTERCPDCKGKGAETCSECKGKGVLPCERFGKKKACEHCRKSAGTIACPVCKD